MQIKFWAATDTGLTRDHNEDNFLVDRKLHLFIVADGMGGHAAGEIASSVAVHEVRKVITDQREVIENYQKSGSVLLRQTVLTLIERSISLACQQVHRLAQEDSERHGMGTTLSLLLVARGRGFIGHVGDSRIYRTRKDQVTQITEDHSVINELIKSGRLKPGDAFNSPYKNAVTRAVGVHPSVEVDTFDFEIQVGDNFLLCSDGLSCYLDDDLTLNFLSQDEIKSIPQLLIEHANASGGKDNITAIIVRTVGGEEDPPPIPQSIKTPPTPPVPPPLLSDSVKGEQSTSKTEKKTSSITTTQSLSSNPPPLPPIHSIPQKRHNLSQLPIDLMKLSPLFSFLDQAGLDELAGYAEVITLSPEGLLYTEGEENEELYVLLKGEMRLEQGDMVIAQLTPGDTMGEERLLNRQVNRVSAISETYVTLLSWNRHTLYALMSNPSHFTVQLLWGLAQMTHQKMLRLQNTLTTTRALMENQIPETQLPPLNDLLPACFSITSNRELTPRFVLNLTPPSPPLFESSLDDVMSSGEALQQNSDYIDEMINGDKN